MNLCCQVLITLLLGHFIFLMQVDVILLFNNGTKHYIDLLSKILWCFTICPKLDKERRGKKMGLSWPVLGLLCTLTSRMKVRLNLTSWAWFFCKDCFSLWPDEWNTMSRLVRFGLTWLYNFMFCINDLQSGLSSFNFMFYRVLKCWTVFFIIWLYNGI